MILLWIAEGYMPWRRIDKERYRLHSIALGKRIWWIDGDRGLPWACCPRGFSRPLINPSWRIYLVRPTAEMKQENSIGNKISYSNPVKLTGTKHETVVVSDTTNKIRKKNGQTLLVTAKFPLSNLEFELGLLSVFLVFSGRKWLKIEEGILVFSEGELEDAIGPWFRDQEVKWQREVTAKLKKSLEGKTDKEKELLLHDSLAMRVISEMEGLRIDNINSIMIPTGKGTQKLSFRDYLNKKFKPYGFKLGELSLKVGSGPKVIELLAERSKQQIAIEKRNTKINDEKTKVVERITLVNDSIAKNAAATNEWPMRAKLLGKIIAGDIAVAAAFKGQVLMKGDEKSLASQVAGPLIANLIEKKEEPSNATS